MQHDSTSPPPPHDGSALLAVVAGRKSWFIRDPSRTLPAWLENTWLDASAQSTAAWLQATAAASPTGKADAWLKHIWYCTQLVGELMFVPESMRHAIHNEEETLAISVQSDMLVQGTPLHATAFHGHEGATRLLLEAGAMVNAKAANGGTPLHHAAFLGHGGVARLLLDAGADIDATDIRGRTPVEVAGDVSMVRLLSLRAGRRTKSKSNLKTGRSHEPRAAELESRDTKDEV